jgi:hypothetical protein
MIQIIVYTLVNRYTTVLDELTDELGITFWSWQIVMMQNLNMRRIPAKFIDPAPGDGECNPRIANHFNGQKMKRALFQLRGNSKSSKIVRDISFWGCVPLIGWQWVHMWYHTEWQG